MSEDTNHTNYPTDPAWALPDITSPGSPVTAQCFAQLLRAAREAGWPGVFTTFSEGETITKVCDHHPSGQYVYEHPRRVSTLRDFFKKRPDLKLLIEDRVSARREALLGNLEREIETIALGDGDITRDFGKDGQLARERTDTRNKLRALEKLLNAHDPERYSERRRVDVAGTIDHQHAHRLGASDAFTITPAQIESLAPAKQMALLDILQILNDAEHTHELIDTSHALPEPQRRDESHDAEGKAGPEDEREGRGTV